MATIWTKVRIALATMALCSLGAMSSQAQTKIEGPVRVIVGFAAGGSTDLLARLVANQVAVSTGAAVVVENKPGAAGLIAVREVLRAAPDGKTLLLAPSSSLTIAPHLQNSEGEVTKLQPITLLTRFAQVAVVRTESPFADLPSIIAAAKKGQRISYGTSGIGSFNHLIAERLSKAAGITMTHVPYNGTAPAAQAIVSGQVDVSFPALQSVVPLIQGKQLRAIATTGAERSALLPDVRTVADVASIPGFEFSDWLGLFAPTGTSAEHVAVLRKAFVDALSDPKIRDVLAKDGSIAVGSESAGFAQEFRKTFDEMGALIKDLGIKTN